MGKNLFVMLFLFLAGCANISPFSPDLKQNIDNQNGKIEELKNNQNGLLLEIGKLRQQQDINARDIENAQQGIFNLRGSNNSGVQIFSGDGGLIVLFTLGLAAIGSVLYYRTRALKFEKSAEILAQQIVFYDDASLDDKVFMSALNTDVEKDIYHLMMKNKKLR